MRIFGYRNENRVESHHALILQHQRRTLHEQQHRRKNPQSAPSRRRLRRGPGDRHPHRSDPDPGRHGDHGVPPVRGHGPAGHQDGSVRLLRGPQHRPGRLRERRRSQVPAVHRLALRARVLPPGQRHLPPGAPRALRQARHHAAGQRQPHPHGRRRRPDRHRRGRPRRGRGHGRRQLLPRGPEGVPCPAHGRTEALGHGQGRGPAHAEHPLHQGQRRRRARVRRPRRGHPVGAPARHHHQHGRRDGRDDLRVPVRRGHPAVPEGPEA